MTEIRTFASLRPALLARKGGAKPAMRPQLVPLHQFHEATARQVEDLGWDDMGPELDGSLAGSPEEDPSFEQHEAGIASATDHQVEDLGWNDMGDEPDESHEEDPSFEQHEAEIVPFSGGRRGEPRLPEVLRQRKAIEGGLSGMDTERPRRSAIADGRRAAFTLRLDAERHLQLRLACTIDNCSAQQIVTEALDRLLAEMPEVAALAASVRKRG